MKTLKVQKTWRLTFSCMMGAASLLLCLAPGARAQTYKDTIHVPVTFYDFRSDRTNPEFEQPHGTAGSNANQASYYEEWDNNSIRQVRDNVRAHNRWNMVDSLLDRDGKPRVGRSPYLNHGVRFWFRDWSKLDSYKAKDSSVNGRGYLVQFRPIYTYTNVRNGNATNVLPPIREQLADAAQIYGNDDWANAGEWQARPNTDVGYAYAGGSGTINGHSFTTSGGDVTVGGKTYTITNAYENRVVSDFLVFNHIGAGRYQYDNARFFPMDGKGFETANGGGRDWATSGAANERNNPVNNHNFSFTMELVWDFKMEDNLSFQFRGDDDVWVFINGKLAMDIGGIHNPYTDGFNLNSMRASHGLVNGNTYKMHMFYSERHSNGSSILINTNIISDKLTELNLNVSADTLTAGDSIPAMAVVGTDSEDGKGILKDYKNGRFSWTARDVNGYNTGNQLRVSPPRGRGSNPLISKNDTVHLYAERAYTTIELIGQYCDTTSGSIPSQWQCVADTVRVFVKAATASQLVIEDKSAARWQDMDSTRLRPPPARWDLDTIRIASTATADSGFYAVLRDRFGNWVGPATGTQWQTESTVIATAGQSPNPSLGQGKAIRMADAGSTRIYATSGNMRDTAVVSIGAITFSAIRIGVKIGGPAGQFQTLSQGKIEMTIPSDTTLYVQGRRSDNGQWMDIPQSMIGPLTWSASNFTPAPTMPATGTALNYKYSATAPQTDGRITVAFAGAGSDYVTINAKYSNAAAMRFYDRRGTPTFGTAITTIPPNPTEIARYPVPNQTLTVRAGASIPIVAALFATDPPSATSYLPNMQFLTGGQITWSVVGSTNATVTSSASSCDSATFRSTVAVYDGEYYTVRATYVQGGWSQDIRIVVVPAAAAKVSIESNPDRAVARFPDNTLTLDRDMGGASVYAILRDEWDNFITLSGGSLSEYPQVFFPEYIPRPTTWSVVNTAVVTVQGGAPTRGEGIVTKVADVGNTTLTGEDKSFPTAIKGDLKINVIGTGIDSLRIVDKDGNVITDLVITTNDEPNLRVQGRTTDCDDDGHNPGGPTGNACWSDVPATWGRDDGLTYALIDPPSNTTQWTLDPKNTGKGKITVSRPGNGGTLTTEIGVTIKLGPPTRAELVITTPADQIQAGKPITGVIKYYNRNGEMTSWDPEWQGPEGSELRVYFGDELQGVRNGHKPKVAANQHDMYVDLYTTSDPCDGACYNDVLWPNPIGKEIKFIIYNATDNPHAIRLRQTIVYGDGKSVYLDPLSDRFVVNAGDPKVVRIESNKLCQNGECADTLRLDYSEPDEVVRAVAYDEYGNRVGEIPGDWKSEAPVVVDKPNVPLIVYSPKDAEANGEGQLCVVAKDKDGKQIEDCITVIISGVTTYARTLTTRDNDGCGYLDRIEIKFPKPIDLTEETKSRGKKPRENITITYNGNSVATVDSVTVNLADSSAILWLHDVHPHTGALQTGLKPDITIPDSVFVDAGKQSHRGNGGSVKDGAAPVINTAKLFFPSSGSGKISENWVVVEFSEKIRPTDKSTFSGETYSLKDLFRIYELSGQGKRLAKSKSPRALAKMATDPNADRNFTDVTDKFLDIDNVAYVNDNTLRFNLKNEEIRAAGENRHYININAAGKAQRSTSKVWDEALNVTHEDNRKVGVIYGNAPANKAQAIPNPASPDPKRTGGHGELVVAGKIFATHDKTAVKDIKDGAGGTVIRVNQLYVPNTGKIRCQIKVYDLAGNLVISGESDKAKEDLMKDGAIAGGFTDLDIYWNGYNSKAMKVSPGTYRMVVYVSYTGVSNSDTNDRDKAKNKKYQTTVGMSK